MSDSALSTSLLATCVQDVATRIGDHLPAAYGMTAGAVVLDGDAAAHALPAEAVAVRWPLAGQDAALVIAVTPEAAALLAGPGEDLVAALTRQVQAVVGGLSPLFGGAIPQPEAGVEVEATRALAEGPGDGVSVALEDAGTHRVTVGLRMVIGDDLLAPVDAPQPAVTDDAALAVSADSEPPATDPTPQPAAAKPAAARAAAAQTAALAGQPQAQAHPAQFASFDQLTALPGAAHSMAMLGEVEMGVTAELGRTRLTVRDVLGLNPGSIIELDRAAGSPVDVVVNGTLIARGEVVVIDEEFGIRITEILGMAEQPNPFPMQVAQ